MPIDINGGVGSPGTARARVIRDRQQRVTLSRPAQVDGVRSVANQAPTVASNVSVTGMFMRPPRGRDVPRGGPRARAPSWLM